MKVEYCWDCTEANGVDGKENDLAKYGERSLQANVYCTGCGEMIWVDERGIRQDNRFTLQFTYHDGGDPVHESDAWFNTREEAVDFGEAMTHDSVWGDFRVLTRAEYDAESSMWSCIAGRIRKQHG